MAEWINCTNGEGSTVYLNLANVVTMERFPNQRTRVLFNGGADAIDVKDTPEQIIQRTSEMAARDLARGSRSLPHNLLAILRKVVNPA